MKKTILITLLVLVFIPLTILISAYIQFPGQSIKYYSYQVYLYAIINYGPKINVKYYNLNEGSYRFEIRGFDFSQKQMKDGTLVFDGNFLEVEEELFKTVKKLKNGKFYIYQEYFLGSYNQIWQVYSEPICSFYVDEVKKYRNAEEWHKNGGIVSKLVELKEKVKLKKAQNKLLGTYRISDKYIIDQWYPFEGKVILDENKFSFEILGLLIFDKPYTFLGENTKRKEKNLPYLEIKLSNTISIYLSEVSYDDKGHPHCLMQVEDDLYYLTDFSDPLRQVLRVTAEPSVSEQEFM